MAGSLHHILEYDGKFTMDLIEDHRDAQQALEECHQIIAVLLQMVDSKSGDDLDILQLVCHNLGFPKPAAAPHVQPELHGPSSIFKNSLVSGEA